MSKIIRTVQEKIFPNEEQKQKIRQIISCCRFVYNYMLSEKLWREIIRTMGLKQNETITKTNLTKTLKKKIRLNNENLPSTSYQEGYMEGYHDAMVEMLDHYKISHNEKYCV